MMTVMFGIIILLLAILSFMDVLCGFIFVLLLQLYQVMNHHFFLVSSMAVETWTESTSEQIS